MMMFTAKDIRKVGLNWWTIDVVSTKEHIESKVYGDRIRPELHVDLAQSRFDKRDWIISTRDDFTLNQDGGVVEVYSKRCVSMAELKEKMLEVANKYADRN